MKVYSTYDRRGHCTHMYCKPWSRFLAQGFASAHMHQQCNIHTNIHKQKQVQTCSNPLAIMVFTYLYAIHHTHFVYSL